MSSFPYNIQEVPRLSLNSMSSPSGPPYGSHTPPDKSPRLELIDSELERLISLTCGSPPAQTWTPPPSPRNGSQRDAAKTIKDLEATIARERNQLREVLNSAKRKLDTSEDARKQADAARKEESRRRAGIEQELAKIPMLAKERQRQIELVRRAGSLLVKACGNQDVGGAWFALDSENSGEIMDTLQTVMDAVQSHGHRGPPGKAILMASPSGPSEALMRDNMHSLDQEMALRLAAISDELDMEREARRALQAQLDSRAKHQGDVQHTADLQRQLDAARETIASMIECQTQQWKYYQSWT